MRWLTPAVLLLSAQGCIYYDGNGDGSCEEDGSCWGDDWFDDTGADTADVSDDTGDTAGSTDTSTDTSDTCDTEEPIVLALAIEPAEATPCSTFIASVRESTGTLDLTATSSVQFFGPVHVLSSLVRSDEVLLSLAVDTDAVLGPADLLLQFGDGTAAFLDNALTIVGATEPPPADCICSDAGI